MKEQWQIKKSKNIKKEVKGITLIALVVTIIVLLILAGITIGILINNGLIQRANFVRGEYTNAQGNEQKELNKAENLIDKYPSNNFEEIILYAELFSFTSIDSNWDVKNVKEALDFLYN